MREEKHTFTCDKCGRSIVSDRRYRPDGWHSVRLEFAGYSQVGAHQEFDVCAFCISVTDLKNYGSNVDSDKAKTVFQWLMDKLRRQP